MQQYQNSAERDKFRGLAQNSAAHRKLWTLLININVNHNCLPAQPNMHLTQSSEWIENNITAKNKKN